MLGFIDQQGMRGPDQALIIITNPALLHVTHIFSLTEMCGNVVEVFKIQVYF